MGAKRTVRKMFTRIPTFIPTSPENNVSSNGTCATPRARRHVDKTATSCNGTVKAPGYMGSMQQDTVNSRRRKRKTYTLRKRVGTQVKSEESCVRNNRRSDNTLPLIRQELYESENEVSDAKNIKYTTSNRGAVSQGRLRTPHQRSTTSQYSPGNRVENSRATQYNDHSLCEMHGENNMDLDLNYEEGVMHEGETSKTNSDTDMLTQPKLHKRNRRRQFAGDESGPVSHASQTKRHARNDEVVDELETSEVEHKQRESLMSRSGQNNEGGLRRSFRSKIPVRFPDIQGNTKTKPVHTSVKPSHSTLPPIYPSSARTDGRSGIVTKSILDYQNILENDFKRLGENLDNTFKLLHQYIQRSRNTPYE